MDYHRTTEKYRRRETQAQVRFWIRTGIVVLALCIGWLIGNSRPSPVSDSEVANLTTSNARLTQELASAQAELARAQQTRRESELLAHNNGGNGDGDSIVSAQRLVARQIARGVPLSRLSQTLQTLATPTRCREIETRDIEVVTPYFTGGEGNRYFLSDTLVLFIEGEAQAAASGQTWYDTDLPVVVRASYLGGEVVTSDTLPFTMQLATGDWVIRVALSATDLNGYIRVALSKCVFE